MIRYKNRDPREFRRYVKLADDGTVISTHDLASGTVPRDQAGILYVDVTDYVPADVHTLKFDHAAVATAQQKARQPVTLTALLTASADVATRVPTKDGPPRQDPPARPPLPTTAAKGEINAKPS